MTTIDGTLFYANWCGWCKNFRPEWNKLKQNISQINGKYKGVSITCHEFEDSQLKSIGGAKIRNKDIRGYPTIKITLNVNGKKYEGEYEGKRTANDILHYMKHIISQIS